MDQVLFVAGEKSRMATLSVEKQPHFFLVDFGQRLSKLIVTVE